MKKMVRGKVLQRICGISETFGFLEKSVQLSKLNYIFYSIKHKIAINFYYSVGYSRIK